MSNAVIGLLLVTASLIFFIWVGVAVAMASRRRAKRARRVESALEMALGKIIRGKISDSDREWAELVRDRLYEGRR